MKRILVPTDFSDHSIFALKIAAQIAKDNGASLFVLNLLDLPTHMNDAVSNGVNIPEVMLFLNKTNQKLDNLVNEVFLESIDVTTCTRIEKVFDGILSYSKDHNIDLIVMGSHGSNGYNDLFIGSNTDKVVRSSGVPVLVIKSEVLDFKVNKFVFASDFSDETKKPFKNVVDFAKIFGAHLNLVRINTPNSFKTDLISEKLMYDFVKEFDIKDYSLHIFNDLNVEKGIINFAIKIDADLIGVCTHGRTSFAHFFVGSTSEGLVHHSVKPVITFRI